MTWKVFKRDKPGRQDKQKRKESASPNRQQNPRRSRFSPRGKNKKSKSLSPPSSPLTSASLPHYGRETYPVQQSANNSIQKPFPNNKSQQPPLQPKSQQHPHEQQQQPQKGLSQSEKHTRSSYVPGPSSNGGPSLSSSSAASLKNSKSTKGGGSASQQKLQELQPQFYKNSNVNVLHRAVSRRDIVPDVHFLQELMNNRPSIIYEQDDMGCTPLHLAVANPKVNLPIVQLLVQEAPENCSVRDKSGCTALIYALDRNDVDLVRILLNAHPEAAEIRDTPPPTEDNGAEEKLPKSNGGAIPQDESSPSLQSSSSMASTTAVSNMLPLHRAMKQNLHFDIVNLLLELYPEGAEEKDGLQVTPLHYGVLNNASIQSIELLLKAYPEAVEEKGQHGMTLLHYAIVEGVQHSVIKLLLKYSPVAASIKDYAYMTPLYYGIIENVDIQIMQALLQHHPEAAMEKDKVAGITPVHYGIVEGVPVQVLQSLIQACPQSAQVVDEVGMTPLSYAIENAAPNAVVATVVQAYTEAVYQKDLQHKTPLTRALEKGSSPQIIQTLVTACPQSIQQEFCSHLDFNMSAQDKKDDVVHSTSVSSTSGMNMNLVHKAILEGYSHDTIRTLAQACPDAMHERDASGMTPLYYCIENREVVGILLEACSDAAFDRDGDFQGTILHYALSENVPFEVVQDLLEVYPGACTQKDIAGQLPLHYAMEEKEDATTISADTLELVVQTYPQAVLQKDDDGITPLSKALAHHQPQHVESIETLLNFCPEGGVEALRYALVHQNDTESSMQLVQMILTACPDAASEKDDEDRIPLVYGLQRRKRRRRHRREQRQKEEGRNSPIIQSPSPTPKVMSSNSSNGSNSDDRITVEVVQLLIEAYPEGAKEKDLLGNIPLHHAITSVSSAPVLEALLISHPDGVREHNNDKITPLQQALEKYPYVPLESIQFMLQACPASVLEKNQDGMTGLHTAVLEGLPVDVLDKLLNVCPDAAMVKDTDGGMTPLMYAILNDAPLNVIKSLLESCPESTSIPDADGTSPFCCSIARVEVLQAILDTDPDAVRAVDNKEGSTALHFAVEERVPTSIVEFLLEAYPEATTVKDTHGRTPLHKAVGHHGSSHHRAPLEAVQLLLKACPDAAKEKDEMGRTPLYWGIEMEASVSIIQSILEACPEAAEEEDDYGCTPLHIAMHRAAPTNVVETIWKANPDAINKKNHQGTTPLHCGVMVNADFDTTKFVFERCTSAACQQDGTGSSALTSLVGRVAQITNKETLSTHGLARRLQLLFRSCRDGRALSPLVQNEESTPLCTFFSIMDETPILELTYSENAATLPTAHLDLNGEPIDGWTMLEILVDLNTQQASDVFFNIKDQLEKGCTRVTISNDSGELASFISNTAVLKTTWQRVADRAKASKVKELQLWGECYGRFLGKYLIDDKKEPKHRSKNSVLVFGSEFVYLDNGQKEEKQVMLKFMSDNNSFSQEIDMREIVENSTKSGANANKYVAMARAAFTAEPELGDLPGVIYRDDFLDHVAEYEHLQLANDHPDHVIVMECGSGLDLGDIMRHQRFEGEDELDNVLDIARSIAEILSYLNDVCAIMHGGVHAGHFVSTNDGHFMIVDFTSSDVIGKGVMTQRQSSTGYLPPEQAAITCFENSPLRNVSSTDGSSMNSELQQELMILEKKLEFHKTMMDKAEPQFRPYVQASIEGIHGQIQAIENSTRQEESIPEELEASAQYDMWCFGLVLYQLCTKKHLFYVDGQGNVDLYDLVSIRDFTVRELDTKLSDNFPDEGELHTFIPLVRELLDPDPSKRPSSWESVLDMLECTI